MASDLPPKGVKRELPPEVSPISGFAPVKRQATESHTVQPTPAKFLWATCQDMNESERLHIKEIAVEQAEDHCLRIQRVLESALGKTKGDASSTGSLAIERKMFNQWLEELNNLRNRHHKLEILVGVEGPTGAGKSSFLAALVGLSELFPSGQQGAATAVVGKASWNWDDKPGSEFRAKILKNSLPSDCDDPEEREDEITNTENRVKWELPRIKAVWGMKREELQAVADTCNTEQSYHKALQLILKKNPQACRFLQDGAIEFSAAKRKELNSKVKPFLDSTAVNHGAGLPFSVWPLIQDVHMYVKSNFLRPGMTVVDLPGCGDATASRGEIAKKFSHRLDVRLVVSPIARATDEKQGQALMQSGFDEAQMKIRGKYDGRGFGVILSKMDEIDVGIYIEGSYELQSDPETSEKLGDLKKLRKRKEKGHSKLKTTQAQLEWAARERNELHEDYRMAMEGLVPGSEGKFINKAKITYSYIITDQSKANGENVEELKTRADNATAACKRGLDMIKTCKSNIEKVCKEIEEIEDWLHDKVTQTRNQYVKDRLQENHAIRQAALNRSDKGSPPLPIFPISSKAYWKLRDKKPPIQSFTTYPSTGLPAVREWLIGATMSKREKHLDDILGAYQGLMAMMRFYSQEKGIDTNFNISRSTVESALAQTHREFSIVSTYMVTAESEIDLEQNLGTNLSKAAMKIQELNPLEDVKRICKASSDEAVRVAAKWSRKYPADDHDPEMMRCNTYTAILSRNGSTYTQKGTGITYNWLEDLGGLLLRSICKEWDDQMNQRLMEIKAPIMEAFKKTWTEYVSQLKQDIRDNLPALEVSFNNFAATADDGLLPSDSSIQKMLDKLSEDASEVTDDVVELYGQELEPVFETALNIKGNGAYKRRRDSVTTKIRRISVHIARPIVNKLSARLEARKAVVPQDLRRIAQEAIDRLKHELSFHLHNLLENYPTNEELKKEKIELQKDIRVRVEEWELAWQPRESKDEKTMSLDLKSPGDTQVIIEDDDCDSDKGEEVVNNPLEAIGDDMENLFRDEEMQDA
ncbi:Nuclear GTPase SLIP-GC [Fusarium oxysporum f. sp. conglutinans]|nr:Nuclear GTPase SLIP-GC [Fusarium oxysporum f. sp. conglutinans]